MPNDDGSAKLGPKRQKLLVELIGVAAKAVGLTERAKVDGSSGAVTFGNYEVWDDDEDATGEAMRLYVASTYYPPNRDEQPEADVAEIPEARTRSAHFMAAEVVKRAVEQVVSAALEDHSLHQMWLESARAEVEEATGHSFGEYAGGATKFVLAGPYGDCEEARLFACHRCGLIVGQWKSGKVTSSKLGMPPPKCAVVREATE